MNKILATIIFIGVAVSAFAAKGLVVTQKYTDANVKADMTVTWYVSQSSCKMKMTFNDAKVNTVNWFFPDVVNSQLLTYGEGPVPAGVQKAYYAIPVKNIQADKSIEVSRIKVERTAETKTMAGMNCEKILVKTNRTITEMWVTKDFKADYYKFYAFFQNSTELMGLSEEQIQGFPLASVTKDLSGKLISSAELISATPTEFTDADFKVPSDYVNAADVNTPKK